MIRRSSKPPLRVASSVSGGSAREVVTEDEFWDLLDRLQPLYEVGPLVAALEERSGPEILAFREHLVAALHTLNTEAHQKQVVSDIEDDPAVEPLPPSEDAFLYARLAVVGHGRQVWAAAAADPSNFGDVWDMALGEELGEAAGIAYKRVTGEPWVSDDLDTPRDATVGDLPPAPRFRRLSVQPPDWTGERQHKLPHPYTAHLRYLEEIVREDRTWWDWWDAARGQESSLECWFQFHDKATVRTSWRIGKDFGGQEVVYAVIVMPVVDAASPPPVHTDPSLAWSALARQHFDLLLRLIKQKLDLDPPVQLKPDIERAEANRKARQRRENQRQSQEAAAWDAHQRHRSSEYVWRGRAPDDAVDELMAAVEAGKRIVALPQLIADLRHRHDIAPLLDDVDRLREAGYSPAEIAIALG